ncbi:cysteine--tRNA ligase [Salinarimonas sp.]|uniref:cysteine--tRNA ligase n=1 Tax=Salinarimonas sp. TaxID=2766526 RepID=UPI00391DB5F5
MATSLSLYNTLSRTKEPFRPIDPAHVRMYVCGPTVYDFAHIGNARPVIVFDVLYRLLRHLYGAEHVTYVRNITDVDDKINARAARDFPGLPLNEAIRKVTEATETRFKADAAALGCLPPDVEPRATQHLDEMRMLIERLVARGCAYVADDHVLFSVAAMERLPNRPRYGSLARRSLDEMIAGARVDVASYKRDEMDFVLWKPSSESEPGWPSPCGIARPGRPGWHIECSAMAWRHLIAAFDTRVTCDAGAREIFDIHGGGIDLVFPHHENEIAQTCCALNTPRMANVWMHNGFLMVEGEKMSKSLGNFVTISDLLETETFGGRRWPGDVLRLAMLKTHYRQPIDWTVDALESSARTLNRWTRIAKENDVSAGGEVDDEFARLLCDDLNTPAAIARVHQLFNLSRFSDETMDQDEQVGTFGFGPGYSGFSGPEQRRASIETGIACLRLLGLDLFAARPVDLFIVQALLAQRKAARAAKNWAESDRLRDVLAEMGVVVKDGKDETTWEVAR